MALIFMSHWIKLTFDSESEASSAYDALEKHVEGLSIHQVRANDRAEYWIVDSEILYDSTASQIEAINRIVQGIGDVDMDARNAFDVETKRIREG